MLLVVPLWRLRRCTLGLVGFGRGRFRQVPRAGLEARSLSFSVLAAAGIRLGLAR